MIKKNPNQMSGFSTKAACLPNVTSEEKDKEITEEPSIEYLRRELAENRRRYAHRLVDLFQSLDNMSDTEFFEIVSTLDGDGLQIGALIEKFRKFKKS